MVRFFLRRVGGRVQVSSTEASFQPLSGIRQVNAAVSPGLRRGTLEPAWSGNSAVQLIPSILMSKAAPSPALARVPTTLIPTKPCQVTLVPARGVAVIAQSASGRSRRLITAAVIHDSRAPTIAASADIAATAAQSHSSFTSLKRSSMSTVPQPTRKVLNKPGSKAYAAEPGQLDGISVIGL